MKQQCLHKILASSLLVIFFFSITPAAFIHHLLPHNDTDDTGYLHHGTTFSSQHRHCSFLHLEQEPYVASHIAYQAPATEVSWYYIIPFLTFITAAPAGMLPSRAPPAYWLL